MTRLLLMLGLLTLPQLALAQTEEVRYFHSDAIGSVRLVTDANGQVVESYDYLPFGEAYPSSASVETRRFGGKERDAETGFDYFGARYYSSGNGRFTTVDPVLNVEEAIVDPQRWNRYAYVTNNPFRYIDPDGRDLWDALAGLGNAFASNFNIAPRGSGNSDYRVGQFIGDLASVPAGFTWANGGVGLMFGGVAGAPETGGASLVVSAGGAAMVAQGVVAAGKGVANAGVYMSQNNDGSGSYTVTFESGKKYHGKGGEERAKRSAERVGKENNDPAKDVDWKPSASDKEGFKDEARRIRKDGGVRNPNNYNRRNSPGEKDLDEEP
jgi:RHS repeat-associated protein